jgi:hypothetical protein
VLQADAKNLQEFGIALPRWPARTKLAEILSTALEEASLKRKTPEEALLGAAAEWDPVLQAEGWQD